MCSKITGQNRAQKNNVKESCYRINKEQKILIQSSGQVNPEGPLTAVIHTEKCQETPTAKRYLKC